MPSLRLKLYSINTKREVYAALLLPNFQVHWHSKVIDTRSYKLSGPHPSARGIRIDSKPKNNGSTRNVALYPEDIAIGRAVTRNRLPARGACAAAGPVHSAN